MNRADALRALNAWAADFKVGIIPEPMVREVIEALAEDAAERQKLLGQWFIDIDNTEE